MTHPIRILLVDDSPYFLEAARDFLQFQESLTVIDTATEGQDALAKSIQSKPHVILLDLNLTNVSGLELIPMFRKHLPQVKIIALTLMQEESYRAAALNAGADAFVPKTAMAKILVSTIMEIMGWETSSVDEVPVHSHAKQDETYFLRLAERLPDLMIYRYEFAPQRGFTYVSPSATAMTGYTPEDHYADLDLRFKLVHPDDLYLLLDVAEGKADMRKPLVLRWIRKDGSIFWTEQQNAPVFDANGNMTAIEGVARDITERKQAEEKLSESEDRYRDLVENIHDLICTHDLEGRILSANLTAIHSLGYNLDEVLGRKLDEFIPPLVRRHFKTYLFIVQKRGEAKGLMMVLTKGGETRVWEYRNTLRTIGVEKPIVRGYARDVTEQRLAEAALRKSEERFRNLVENSSDEIWILDAKGEILYESPTAHPTLGYRPGEFLGRNLFQLIHPDNLEHVREQFARLLENPQLHPREQFRLRHRNGEWRWVEAVGSNLLADSSVRGVVINYHDITDRKQAEDEVQKVREFNQALLDNMSEGIVVQNTDGYFIFANPAATNITGYSSVELLGAHWTKFFPEDQHEIIRKADHLRAAGRASQYELDFLHRNGARINLLISGSPLFENGQYNGSMAVFTDITERKQAEAKIQQQFERIKALREIDSMIASAFDMQTSLDTLISHAVRLLSVDACAVLLVNRQQDALVYAAGIGFRMDIIKTTCLGLGESFAGRAALERRMIQIPDLSGEESALFRAGFIEAEGFYGYYGIPLVVKGNVIGVMEVFSRAAVGRDAEWLDFFNTLAGQAAIAIDHAQLIGDLQRTNDELEQRVQERTAELERANRAKDEFLANMSHELRTPLNGILGVSEMLLEQQRDPLSEHQRKFLKIVESSGRHLLELINDILDVSRIEAGKSDYHPEWVGVNEICQSSLTLVRSQAVRKAITLDFERDARVSTIQADPRRLKQILVNLLNNAVKFTSDNGQVTLRVVGDVENDAARFSVIDNGIGIAPEHLQLLFRPFSQVDSSLNRQQEGTGLGLALVQKLTDLHGGSVHVESEPGRGSVFTVVLPWKSAPVLQPGTLQQEEGESHARPSPVSAEVFKQRTILLAEDNPANILAVGDYLESHGFIVKAAHDGLEAIQLAEQIDPDVILMDIQMPAMDGLEAIRRLRANPRFASTPIIALTALAMPGDRERCLEAGADEYISKPVSLKSLVNTIRNLSP